MAARLSASLATRRSLSVSAPRRAPSSLTVNDRAYALPTAPTVVVCIDGSEPAYMHHGVTFCFWTAGPFL